MKQCVYGCIPNITSTIKFYLYVKYWLSVFKIKDVFLFCHQSLLSRFCPHSDTFHNMFLLGWFGWVKISVSRFLRNFFVRLKKLVFCKNHCHFISVHSTSTKFCRRTRTWLFIRVLKFKWVNLKIGRVIKIYSGALFFVSPGICER